MSAQQPDVTALVAEREQILAWLKPAQAREMEIRRQLALYFFPQPVEGTQQIEKDGFNAALQHKLNYKLDEAALNAVMLEMPEHYRNLGVLVKYKPALVLDGYRALETDLRMVFDQALTITEGAPTLDIKAKPAPGGVVATVTGGVMRHIPDVAAHKHAAALKENADLERSAKRVEKATKKSSAKTKTLKKSKK